MFKRTTTTVGYVISAALVLTMVGCSQTAKNDVHQAAAKLDQSIDNTGQQMSDSWITSKIKSTLAVDHATPALDIHVFTVDGVVTLSGNVATQHEKDVAIQRAQGIKGVKRVIADNLRVGR